MHVKAAHPNPDKDAVVAPAELVGGSTAQRDSWIVLVWHIPAVCTAIKHAKKYMR